MSVRLPFIYVAEVPKKGRGVFTARFIPEGSSIESCPVIELSAADKEVIHQTHLHDYYFLWGEEGGCALALGYGSMYNHASNPNANYEMDNEHKTIDVFAIRDIQAGEEITISYTDGEEEDTVLWFDEE